MNSLANANNPSHESEMQNKIVGIHVAESTKQADRIRITSIIPVIVFKIKL